MLLSFWSGGASCCADYQIVRVSAQGAFATERFGSSAEAPSQFRIAPEGIGFRLERSYPADTDHLRVFYNGESVRVTRVIEDDRGIGSAGPGGDVVRWVGMPSTHLFEVGGERVRFRNIMDAEALNALRASLMVGKRLERQGGYLIGGGCWPHRCASHFGYVAIEIATGRPLAALTTPEGLRTFGGAEADFPDALRALMARDRAVMERARR